MNLNLFEMIISFISTKGQKKSKWLFSSKAFLQKTNKQILLYYCGTSDWFVFVHFLEEIDGTKNIFQNWLTFKIINETGYGLTKTMTCNSLKL